MDLEEAKEVLERLEEDMRYLKNGLYGLKEEDGSPAYSDAYCTLDAAHLLLMRAKEYIEEMKW